MKTTKAQQAKIDRAIKYGNDAGFRVEVEKHETEGLCGHITVTYYTAEKSRWTYKHGMMIGFVVFTISPRTSYSRNSMKTHATYCNQGKVSLRRFYSFCQLDREDHLPAEKRKAIEAQREASMQKWRERVEDNNARRAARRENRDA